MSLLTGKNGCGKTTLMKIMAGLSKPTQGSIELDEAIVPVYVAHATFLYPKLTAMENLSFWNRCLNLQLRYEDLADWLEKMGLYDFADIEAGTFSRGMCQRLNLARALMQKPSLLLLDEPATGLDYDSRQLLQNELLSLKSAGSCIVLISHDLAEDAPLADHILRLEGGKLACNPEAVTCGA
ncbi:MAG: ABC transporter ATP-binding protein [Desulfovibrio sp.]|nr:ABC transporter ATP-binding protein [Desulfovibrio sp.]